MCGEEEDIEVAVELNGYFLEETKKGLVRLLTTASGVRAPGVSKQARECWCAVEGAPP